MCGRFDVDAREPKIRELVEKLPITGDAVKLGEIFPGNLAMGIAAKGSEWALRSFRWGFPKKQSKSLIINARAETALQKPLFANALKKNPIAIPATGFYEWRPNLQTGLKDKFLFIPQNGGVFYLAGFWRFFEHEPASDAFVILTTAANASMRPYHHRMPIFLAQEEVEAWIKGGEEEYFLTRVPPSLDARLC